MQVKRTPLDLRAEPALEPRRPFKADVAERSYVVAPHVDPGNAVGCLGHPDTVDGFELAATEAYDSGVLHLSYRAA